MSADSKSGGRKLGGLVLLWYADVALATSAALLRQCRRPLETCAMIGITSL